MIRLFQWYLSEEAGYFCAHGVVAGHYKLREGSRIHTSAIVRAWVSEEGLRLDTASGSHYLLGLGDWTPVASKGPPPDVTPLGLGPDFWERTRAAEEAQEAAAREMDFPPRTLYLRMVGNRVLTAFWRGAPGPAREVPFTTHVGMFQDSVLVSDEVLGRLTEDPVDFRYFPLGVNRADPYLVSTDLEALLVRNEGTADILFGRSEEDETCCPPGADTRVPLRKRPGPQET